ncbi:MAG: DNA repair protein RecO C-terminal domain-containing protein [Paludibacteraceae bacterium]|nr:DNA repair protein RecO C-terminal domain-containing protein [Paludibacteraceae bacterium]
MLHTTDAIVLALQPQSDKVHLLHAYTRAGGRVNYKVYGIGKHHAAGVYTPFSLIQITADYPSVPSRLPSVREATRLMGEQRHSVGDDFYKHSIALFLSEVLYRTLRHPMPDDRLFDFLASAVIHLSSLPCDDSGRMELSNFHIVFLVSLAAQLGFAIDENVYPELMTLPQNRSERQQQLLLLCNYFAEHVDTWQHPKSLEILSEVFD